MCVGDGEDNQPKRRGRKGHSKSRKGCYNCKKARIKVFTTSRKRLNEPDVVPQCKENRPSCDYCTHRGLQCEWPDLQLITQVDPGKQDSQIGTVIRNTLPQISLPLFQSETPIFTMQDFRLFNYFIKSAYPSHPVGNESVWTHEIPSLASNVRIPHFPTQHND